MPKSIENIFQRKKVEDKRMQREDEKQKKKIQIAKNVPAPIKEAKDEANFEDGIMVRTVPSRLSRSDRRKDSKSEAKPKSEASAEIIQEKRDKIKTDRDTRRKSQRDEKRKADREQRDQAKGKEDSMKPSGAGDKPSGGLERPKTSQPREPRESKRDVPAKSETKRYSALRKARQEKPDDDISTQDIKKPEDDSGENPIDVPQKPVELKVAKDSISEQAKLEAKEARIRKNQEHRERRAKYAREADERAQRQIKNKDRPTLQIYQPKRRQDTDPKPENSKSSDEARKTESDNERKNEKPLRRPGKNSRKNSRDETARKKKTSRKNSADGEIENALVNRDSAAVVEKLEKLLIEEPSKSESETKIDVQD